MRDMNKSNERIKIQQQWEYSKRKLHHSISIEQMAKRLRLNLENFGRFHDLEKKLWADPLPDFIISLYEKRFGNLS